MLQKSWVKSLSFILLSLQVIAVHGSAQEVEVATWRNEPIEFREVATRLLRPWDMVFLSDNDVLITEKEGGVQRVNLKTGAKIEIAGLPDDLDNRNRTGLGDNAGLFSIVLDPAFDENRWLYLSYAATNDQQNASTTKVIRAKFNRNRLSNIETLLVAEPFSADRYHYGGGLVFGRDQKLYITIGERLFNEVDQPALPIAQDLSDRRGKIYRLNADGSVPADNPEFNEPSVPGLYGLGIRAAQGLTVHPKTGAIWFSEHGTRQGDEINLLAPGANYGWPIHTDGGYRHQAYQPPKLEGRVFTDPSWSWEKTVAPTGLTFYDGVEFPHWNGSLLVAGLSRGSLWRMIVDDTQVIGGVELMIDQRVRLRNVRQAPDGTLYVLTDEANGRVLRISRTGDTAQK